jgi:hypothetical protein
MPLTFALGRSAEGAQEHFFVEHTGVSSILVYATKTAGSQLHIMALTPLYA